MSTVSIVNKELCSPFLTKLCKSGNIAEHAEIIRRSEVNRFRFWVLVKSLCRRFDVPRIYPDRVQIQQSHGVDGRSMAVSCGNKFISGIEHRREHCLYAKGGASCGKKACAASVNFCKAFFRFKNRFGGFKKAVRALDFGYIIFEIFRKIFSAFMPGHMEARKVFSDIFVQCVFDGVHFPNLFLSLWSFPLSFIACFTIFAARGL